VDPAVAGTSGSRSPSSSTRIRRGRRAGLSTGRSPPRTLWPPAAAANPPARPAGVRRARAAPRG